jgi:cytochrome P450 monooxygenase
MTVTVAQIEYFGKIVRDEVRIIWILVALVLLAYLILPNPTYRTNVQVPTIRYLGGWIPDQMDRLFFNTKAASVIYDGYKQVSGKKGAGFSWVLMPM